MNLIDLFKTLILSEKKLVNQRTIILIDLFKNTDLFWNKI